jgi:hypothetical protein
VLDVDELPSWVSIDTSSSSVPKSAAEYASSSSWVIPAVSGAMPPLLPRNASPAAYQS